MSSRTIYLTFDVGTGQVLTTLGFQADSGNLKFAAGDSNAACLRITFQNTIASGSVLPFVVGASAIKTLTIKKITGADSNGFPTFDAAALILSENDKWNVSGDWNGRDANAGQHSVRLNTNTTAALAAVTSASVKCICEIEIEDPVEGNSTFPTFEILLTPQVHTGSEGTPETPDPLLASQEWVKAQIAAMLEWGENGELFSKDTAGNRVNRLN